MHPPQQDLKRLRPTAQNTIHPPQQDLKRLRPTAQNTIHPPQQGLKWLRPTVQNTIHPLQQGLKRLRPTAQNTIHPPQQGLKQLRPTAQNTTQFQQQLTEGRPDGEDDRISRFLDEVDDVLVVHVGDVHSIHRHDSVPDVQLAAPLRRAALDDSTCNRQRATLAATAALTD